MSGFKSVVQLDRVSYYFLIAQLIVHIVCQTPPVVTVSAVEIQGDFGKSVTMTCNVNANPKETRVYWRMLVNGVLTDVDMTSGRYSGSTVASPSLTIYNLNKADQAYYQCFAQNSVATGNSGQTYLRVIGGLPSVNVGQGYTVNFGNSVTLQCTVIATPSATSVRWNKVQGGISYPIDVANNPTKYSGSTTSMPSLTIYNADNNDQTSYTCQATNAAGTTVSSPTSLSVVGNIPIVRIIQGQYSVIIGNTVTLECTVQANLTYYVVYWKRIINGVETDLPSSGRYSGSTVSNPSLTITNTVFCDIGSYVCYANNTVGRGQSPQTYLNVVGSAPVVSIPQSTYFTNIGNPVTLQCTVSANPIQTSVKWQRVDSYNNALDVDMTNSRYSGSTVSSPSLTISNAVKADEGRYVCMSSNLVGTGTSGQTFLTVVGTTLSLNVSPTSANVILNNNQVIQCIISGSPSATAINWYRRTNNVETQIQIASSNGKYSGGSVSTPALTINSFQSSDAGVYLCKAANAYGTASSQDSVLTFIQPISISIQPLSGTAIVGDASYTINCTVFGTNPTFVSWTKTPTTGGTPTTPTQSTGKYSINSSPTNPKLTILNIVKTDEADYACSAQNLAGIVTSSNARLAVNGGLLQVTIPSPSYSVLLGNQIKIVCNVSGLPAATQVYWEKKNVNGTYNRVAADSRYSGGNLASPTLVIFNAAFSDKGTYRCLGVNAAGTANSIDTQLDVTGSLLGVQISPSNQLVLQGNSQTLTCIVSGSPPASAIIWTKQTTGGAVVMDLSTPAGKYSGGTTSNPSLTINNFQSTDAATYVCRATNAAGTASSTQTVLTYAVPLSVSVSPPGGKANYGDKSYTIQCTVSGTNPSFVSWTKTRITGGTPTTISTGSGKYNINNNPTNPFLTILNIVEEDEADYACTAQNLAGTVTSSNARLIVNGGGFISVLQRLNSRHYHLHGQTLLKHLEPDHFKYPHKLPPGKPVITITPSTVRVGASATVRCTSVGGDPTPTVKISRNSILVDKTATTAAGQTVNDYTFTVKDADRYASFECSVDNGVLQNPLTATEYLFVTSE